MGFGNLMRANSSYNLPTRLLELNVPECMPLVYDNFLLSVFTYLNFFHFSLTIFIQERTIGGTTRFCC